MSSEVAHRKAQTSRGPVSVDHRSLHVMGGQRGETPSVSYPNQRSFTPHSMAKGSDGPKHITGTLRAPVNKTNMR